MDYRLTNKDIENDPTFMVGAFPNSTEKDWYPPEDYPHVEYFSERIISRILGVASTYNLHFTDQFLPNKTDRSIMNFAQVQALEDQLAFLCGLLNDQLIVEAIERIQKLAATVTFRPKELVLVFEGP